MVESANNSKESSVPLIRINLYVDRAELQSETANAGDQIKHNKLIPYFPLVMMIMIIISSCIKRNNENVL